LQYLAVPYQPTKVAVRDVKKYWTSINDDDLEWKEKYQRRDSNLLCGYFSDISKPYKSVGNMCLEAGDLLLNSTINILKSEVGFKCCTFLCIQFIAFQQFCVLHVEFTSDRPFFELMT